MRKIGIFVLAFLIAVVLSKELLLIDEEFVLIIAFSLFVIVLYNNIRNVLSTALDERVDYIKQLILSLIQLKRASLLANYEVLNRISSTIDELLDLITFIKHKLHMVDVEWNKRFDFLLNYTAKMHLNLLVQEELDLLYVVYFKSIAHLFVEMPFWLEHSAKIGHEGVEDLGLSKDATGVTCEILNAKLSGINDNRENDPLTNNLFVIMKELGFSPLQVSYILFWFAYHKGE